jgi:hypothetical protein
LREVYKQQGYDDDDLPEVGVAKKGRRSKKAKRDKKAPFAATLTPKDGAILTMKIIDQPRGQGKKTWEQPIKCLACKAPISAQLRDTAPISAEDASSGGATENAPFRDASESATEDETEDTIDATDNDENGPAPKAEPVDDDDADALSSSNSSFDSRTDADADAPIAPRHPNNSSKPPTNPSLALTPNPNKARVLKDGTQHVTTTTRVVEETVVIEKKMDTPSKIFGSISSLFRSRSG